MQGLGWVQRAGVPHRVLRLTAHQELGGGSWQCVARAVGGCKGRLQEAGAKCWCPSLRTAAYCRSGMGRGKGESVERAFGARALGGCKGRVPLTEDCVILQVRNETSIVSVAQDSGARALVGRMWLRWHTCALRQLGCAHLLTCLCLCAVQWINNLNAFKGACEDIYTNEVTQEGGRAAWFGHMTTRVAS